MRPELGASVLHVHYSNLLATPLLFKSLVKPKIVQSNLAWYVYVLVRSPELWHFWHFTCFESEIVLKPEATDHLYLRPSDRVKLCRLFFFNISAVNNIDIYHFLLPFYSYTILLQGLYNCHFLICLWILTVLPLINKASCQQPWHSTIYFLWCYETKFKLFFVKLLFGLRYEWKGCSTWWGHSEYTNKTELLKSMLINKFSPLVP